MRINLEQENKLEKIARTDGSISHEWIEAWQAAYRILEQNIAPSLIRTWINPLFLDRVEPSASGNTLTFVATNDFAASWVRDNYLKLIETALATVTGVTCHAYFTVNEGPEVVSPVFEPAVASDRAPAHYNVGSTSFSPEPSTPRGEITLNPQYTFDNFIVGASNHLTHASAVAVAEMPGHRYNPLFIHSNPGLGKTHLLHAIGNEVLSRNPKARIGYVSAETFVNELVEAIGQGRMAQFRTRYRENFDVLLMDDVQFLARKKACEEEFFHTFNTLRTSHRQIVVTSDRPPEEMADLEERIRTRFEGGLVADIQPPEIETRIAILKAKAERDDIYLPDDVATFLATHIKENIRQLEGVLVKLQASASLTGAEISLDMAKQQLKNFIPEEGTDVTVESIQIATARHFNVKIQDLKSSSRARSVALPRQVAMYLIRKYTQMGFKEIGHYFGGKDHTTVMHACDKIEAAFDTNPEVREVVESVQNLL